MAEPENVPPAPENVPPTPEEMEQIMVSSIVSSKTHEGLVQILWGEKACQLPITAARQFATHILMCCESAETDSALIELFLTKLSLMQSEADDERMAFSVINSMREIRERRTIDRMNKSEETNL